MAYLPAQIDAQQATVRLSRESLWARLARLPRRASAYNSRLPYLEAIWFPHYIVTIHVQSRKGPGQMAVMIDGWSGSFSLLHGTVESLEGAPPGEAFEPKLTARDAERISRENLSRSILAQRSFGPKPEIVGHDPAEWLQYPLYVYYHERRPGRIDIRALDGISGELTGGKLKLGILEAFAERAKSAANATPQPSGG